MDWCHGLNQRLLKFLICAFFCICLGSERTRQKARKFKNMSVLDPSPMFLSVPFPVPCLRTIPATPRNCPLSSTGITRSRTFILWHRIRRRNHWRTSMGSLRPTSITGSLRLIWVRGSWKKLRKRLLQFFSERFLSVFCFIFVFINKTQSNVSHGVQVEFSCCLSCRRQAVGWPDRRPWRGPKKSSVEKIQPGNVLIRDNKLQLVFYELN